MDLAELENKSIAMIVWNTERENDVHVYLGKLQNIGGKYTFVNEEKSWKVSLDDEQLSRLHPVTHDLKETLLNADYALSMSMANLPGTEDKSDYLDTGINQNNEYE